MYFVRFLLGAALIVQIYYLYEFIYSIPMKTDGTSPLRLRGERLFTDNFHEKHTQKHPPQLPLKQTTRDNNTALIYRFAANLGAVSRF
jgi:hypothetical protein